MKTGKMSKLRPVPGLAGQAAGTTPVPSFLTVLIAIQNFDPSFHKFRGFQKYLSKIHGFHGTHGTHANYAPAHNIIHNYVKQFFFTLPLSKI